MVDQNLTKKLLEISDLEFTPLDDIFKSISKNQIKPIQIGVSKSFRQSANTLASIVLKKDLAAYEPKNDCYTKLQKKPRPKDRELSIIAADNSLEASKHLPPKHSTPNKPKLNTVENTFTLLATLDKSKNNTSMEVSTENSSSIDDKNNKSLEEKTVTTFISDFSNLPQLVPSAEELNEPSLNENEPLTSNVIDQVYIERGNHWILGVISLNNNYICIFDSLRLNHNRREHFVELMKITQISSTLAQSKLDMSKFKFYYSLDCEQQNNSFDCGVYVILWAYQIIKGQKEHVPIAEARKFIRYIFSLGEISITFDRKKGFRLTTTQAFCVMALILEKI
ncbi:uncharacterized protein LOC124811169 [Hydra vulgaris]|uniref:uncharacterized protein LOC124811169 n=1 Tax=Hydra vulgaris TaxID=6087 RepID=UPI001F5E97CD|nr:uncharacterized protein LOC124811169 [Hydra vulgaris]